MFQEIILPENNVSRFQKIRLPGNNVSRYRLSNKYKKISLLNIKPQKLIKLNQDILNILKSDSNLILAGGALRTIIDANDEIIDYDIFFNSHCDIKTIIEKFKNIGFTVYWECPKGELFNLRNKNNEKVQLVLPNVFKSPIEWLEIFDIRAGQIALHNNILYISKLAIKDIRKKLIFLENVPYPVATFRRIMKYNKKGYHIYQKEIEALLIKSSNLILSSQLNNDNDWRKYSID